MTEKCVICGNDIPEERKKKDTCSDHCAFIKMRAWAQFLRDKKGELMAHAIAHYKEGSSK